ncbi:MULTISPECIES: fumarylacetoacetate hydrolase family protein [Actinoalloteichus]|uniref:2-keto-4-pentenoate hydratase/2-oxohepta-3-ene-1,7-dioic acid hydratase n=1 Tax=Actinoalloteichus fjordicus TaxID=1612552 RepID=A0AAC9PUJ8_9PSEU|nr:MULTISPECIES: fumarylacetoacetate hydrolase family protein [Actinoalloteichus]APU17182.1 2-keto-4-pentenoate hydratase/2-oxohepta-3-ene-1,7-dioic acid hydratase [Actinoalloteichus fjordicus]APU23265.1 2-keto-4-pentenoate hydratase/2-oxohepta-3-ene-1,7-dioic acid hydratase [Actinoalloteichus sp. GBA129-24]
MRIGRIAHPQGVAFVSIEGEPDTDQVAVEIAEHPFGDPTYTGRRWPLADVRVLAPILPSKVICIGKNYADHAREMGGEPPANPVIFMKPSTSVIGPGASIRLPADSAQVDFEGELAAVIGAPCRDVSPAKAKDVLLGYTIANDVTARDQQKADGQWTRAKGHDTFCPLGPWIDTTADPADLRIRTELDGAVRQDSTTANLLHDVPTLVAWISRVMTLLPGDVILTGTPAGVGPMTAGQTVAITVQGLGTLRNPVVQR